METYQIQSECAGRETLSTKVDEGMHSWIEERAEQTGLSSAEYLRRVLDLYRNSRRGEVPCPSCQERLDLSRGVEP